MRYLVTGGGGFIGSHLAARLAADPNNEVVVLDNFSTGNRSNLNGIKVTLIEGDIRDRTVVERAVQGVDTVFHQAALCSVARSMEDPLTTHDVNITGMLVVLEACRQAKVRRFVFASSSSVYGDSEVLPKHEKLQTAPMSPYAVSKLTGEHYCQLYSTSFGMETVALRYFNVFGPRQYPNSEYAAVIPRFVSAIKHGRIPEIYGDGSQTRDFTYVEDIVQANIAASTSKDAAGQIMNIACGNRWSLLDLLGHLKTLMKAEFSPILHPWRVGDVRHSQASIEKARTLMNFSPGVNFDDGLRETVAWYQQTA
ncbi:MAG: SDR family oxidoreductase [Pseudomonadota bacterium]